MTVDETFDETFDEADRIRSEIEMMLSDRPTELEWEQQERGERPTYPPEFWKGLEQALVAMYSALEAVEAYRTPRES